MAGREPTVRDVLADPIVRMLARSDGLSEREITAAIRAARNTQEAPEPALA
ncbi:hypothetical protein [Limimonas halophila]|nr:hypothetical protein [Limimonas halophila]